MNSKIMAAIAVTAILAIGGGAYVLTSSNDEAADSTDTTQAPDTTQSTTQSDPVIVTARDVAVHNTKEDCWTIVDGNVYDLTSYIPGHQGGDEIIRACGVDGSSLFNERTTDDGETVGSGEEHSDSAASQLENLLIGELSVLES